MKKQLMTMAFGALLISGTAMAVASPSPQDYGNHNDRTNQHASNNHSDNNHAKNNHDNDRNRSYVAHNQGHKEGWYRKGGHVPSQYRDNRYVVTDWRAHHLRQPPRGYHWVRSDNGDFLLVAITTGVITSIIANAIANGH